MYQKKFSCHNIRDSFLGHIDCISSLSSLVYQERSISGGRIYKTMTLQNKNILLYHWSIFNSRIYRFGLDFCYFVNATPENFTVFFSWKPCIFYSKAVKLKSSEGKMCETKVVQYGTTAIRYKYPVDLRMHFLGISKNGWFWFYISVGISKKGRKNPKSANYIQIYYD